jgi:hypothetical protein
MKSGRIFLITLISLFCVSLNAQIFVGGNFTFNTHNDKTDLGTTAIEKISDYSFDFSPKAGMFIFDKLAFGLALDIYFSGSTSGVSTETISKSSGFGLSPFMRYYAVKWNKFSLFGQGNIGLEFSNASRKTGTTTTDGPKTTTMYLSVYPGLSYDISEKLSLEISLNILSFGFDHKTTKQGTSKEVNSGFNIGAGLSNIVSIGAITVGAIYKF